MAFSKKQMFVGLIMIQTVVIFLLLFKVISLKNAEIFSRTEATYYKKALSEMSENEDAAFRSILSERERLIREHTTTRGIARKYRLKFIDSF